MRIAPPFLLKIRMLELWFSGLNSSVLRNAMTFWFYKWPNCFRPYILYKNLYTSLALTNQRSLILGSNFMKIGSLLSPMKLFKKASTMSIRSTKNSKSVDMARKILRNLHLTVGAKVLLKSMSGIWKYLYTISLALYLATDSSRWYFTLNIYLEPIATCSLGS